MIWIHLSKRIGRVVRLIPLLKLAGTFLKLALLDTKEISRSIKTQGNIEVNNNKKNITSEQWKLLKQQGKQKWGKISRCKEKSQEGSLVVQWGCDAGD